MNALAAGFADPVFDSQAVFRAVMRAMARPGRVETIVPLLAPPAPLSAAAAAACLALADFETPMWLSPSLAAAADVVEYLGFHSGAAISRHAGEAAFAVLDVRLDVLDLAAFAQGTPEYPDRSATLVLICETIGSDGGLTLEGPGLKGEGDFAFAPRPADFTAQWRRNRGTFPLGVDLILTAGDRLACLPRTARILREAA